MMINLISMGSDIGNITINVFNAIIESDIIVNYDNLDLSDIDNLIKIIVTAKDGTAKREYKLNAFISSKDFVLFDSSVVNGNLFIASNKVTLKSNVVYSDVIAKDGNQSIDKIITHSTVNGNVFVVCEEFILEPGVEIQGDLYILFEERASNTSALKKVRISSA